MSNFGNFSIHHHERNRVSYREKTTWWEGELASERRCARCWLRTPQGECFCEEFDSLQSKRPPLDDIDGRVEVLMYYHFQELGRSANTAHIFESMNSTITERVVFGDSAAELKLVEQIHEEIRSSRPRTCVLYPDRSAKKLSDWIASRPTACRDTSVRLVALDGTYGQASRQWKYLSRCLHELHGEDLPVVKLDLEDGKCRSAIAGVMAQPGKEKICTYQAVVMAVRQVKRALDGERRLALGEAMNNCKAAAATTTIDGNTTTAILAAGADGMCMNTGGNQVEGEDAGEDAGDRELFQYLDFTLERFLLHILKHRVRMGKRSNRAIEDVDYTPSDQLREHLLKFPPPTGAPEQSRRKQKQASRRAAYLASKAVAPQDGDSAAEDGSGSSGASDRCIYIHDLPAAAGGESLQLRPATTTDTAAHAGIALGATARFSAYFSRC